MYAMICTRTDIGYALGVVSRLLSNPERENWEGVKWILKYLKGAANICICYKGGSAALEAYIDANMAGDVDTKRSTSGYLFTFAGGAISWQSKLQKYVALSTTKPE
ncbi:hypothetical protein LIER_31384 [Lithospermum erythrorhizon]|uniref:Retrovirus-related Pol polyprotein from transposon TNT 1-94 n=1 Tax=Lithospermum erythrorhizon TaxID=34254 RepID=A0AAV3RSW5_LITER